MTQGRAPVQQHRSHLNGRVARAPGRVTKIMSGGVLS